MRRTLLAVLALAGCGSDDPATDVGPVHDGADAAPTDDYVHEPMPVACVARFPATRWHALGPDEDHFLLGAASDAHLLSRTTRAGVTRDRGRSLRTVGLHTWSGEDEPLVPNVLGAREDVAALDADFFSSTRGAEPLDLLGNPLARTVIVGDTGHDVVGVVEALDLPAPPSGATSEMVWRADATHWVARRGFRLWATRDGGADWQRVGLVPSFNLEENRKLATFGERGSLVLVQLQDDPTKPGPFMLVDGDEAPVEVGLPYDGGPANKELATMRFWGDALVFVDGPRAFVSADRGATWTTLRTVDNDPERQYDAVVASTGALYLFPVWDLADGTRAPIMRFPPGADASTEPVIVDLDFGPLDITHFGSLGALADGRLRFVAHPTATREAYSGVLCEAGPGVAPGVETPTVEPVEAALASDRVVRVSRLKDLNDVQHRMAVSGTGNVIGTAWQAIVTLPWDQPPFYSVTYGAIPAPPNLGFLPQALDASMGEWTFAAFLDADDTRPSAYAMSDLRTGLTQYVALPITDDVLAAHPSPIGTLLRTQAGTKSLDLLRKAVPKPNPPVWPNAMITNGMYGVMLSNLMYERLVPALEPAFMARFSPWSEPLPDLTRCVSSPPPPECEALPPMSLLDAAFDLDGNLYVLDAFRARVMMLPAGRPSPDGWVEVGAGFLTPTDIEVRRIGDAWVVFVYDGDGFAFAVDPDAPPKVRGAGDAPARRDVPTVAERDPHDCMAAGPCLFDSTPTAIDLSGLVRSTPVCLNGRGFGTGGKVFAGLRELEVTSWSDGEVCVAPLGLIEHDGRLQLVRDDGVASNRIPFYGAGALERWDVPSEVYPDTPVRAHGTNFGAGLTGAFHVTGDTYLVWPHDLSGEVTLAPYKGGTTKLGETTFVVRPRVQHVCRASRAQGCVLFGAGFSFTSATIGGAPATISATSPSLVELDWPDGLAPGVHRAVLAANGSTIEVDVELLPDAQSPLLLFGDVVSRTAFGYGFARPVALSRGLFVNLDMRDMTEVNGAAVPGDIVAALVEADAPEKRVRSLTGPVVVGPVRARAIGFNVRFEPSRAVHAFEHDGALYAAGTAWRTTSAAIRRLDAKTDPDTGKVEYDQVPIVTFEAPDGIVAAVGALDGKVLVATSGRTGSSTRVTPVTIAEGAGTTGVAAEIDGAWGHLIGGAAPVADGVFFAGDSLYVTSCHDHVAGGHIVHARLTLDGDTLGATSATLLDTADARLTACAATGGGLIWVEDHFGPTSVWLHEAGAAPRELVALPYTLPGINDVFEAMRPVSDVAQLAGGDVLLLIAAHTTEPRGLHLARWHAADDTWTSAHVVTPATMWQRGELCVGPHRSEAVCPGWGRDGCSPFGCAVRPPDVHAKPSMQVGEALMVVRGDVASIVYEAFDTEPLRSVFAYNGSDVFHARVAIPD